MDRDGANGSRFEPGMRGGHYESWFQRANHADKPLAFWNRYTVFCPRGAPDEAIGELWGIWFDGERDVIIAAREEVPVARCRFAKRGLDVRVGAAELRDGALVGGASLGENELAWDLRYEGGGEPLLLLPVVLYALPFPKAKAVIGSPSCVFEGTFVVNGETHRIDGWRGSQSHNWGSAQTDEYAWAQVAGFDGAHESFLECISGRVRLASWLPIWTPRTSFAVLRHEGRTLSFGSPIEAVRAPSAYGVGRMSVTLRASGGALMEVVVSAPKSAFVGLSYRNPPGGVKICHNTKLARCEVRLREKGRETVLVSRQRAALEVLTDAADGVRVVC